MAKEDEAEKGEKVEGERRSKAASIAAGAAAGAAVGAANLGLVAGVPGAAIGAIGGAVMGGSGAAGAADGRRAQPSEGPLSHPAASFAEEREREQAAAPGEPEIERRKDEQ